MRRPVGGCEFEYDGEAASRSVLQVEFSVACCGEGVGDGEAESGAACILVSPPEPMEGMGLVVVGESGTVVANEDLGAVQV